MQAPVSSDAIVGSPEGKLRPLGHDDGVRRQRPWDRIGVVSKEGFGTSVRRYHER